MASIDVRMVSRTLDIIEVFSERRRPLLLTELAEAIGAPVSSCSELINTLKRRGYVYVLGRRRGFYPTRRLLVRAEVIAANDPILQQLDGLLAELRDSTGETVILGRLQGEEVVYLDVLEGVHSIRYSALAGDLKPLHSSAIGKALLAVQTPAQRERLFERLTLTPVTDATIVELDALRVDLERGRTRGYQVTRGENVADVMALATAIDLAGESFAIAVAGPIHRMRHDEKRCAEALARICGGMEAAA